MSDPVPLAPTALRSCAVMRPAKCSALATLRVYSGSCRSRLCRRGCVGHDVCDDHGALLRAGRVPEFPGKPDDGPFTVDRIHTLPGA